MLALLAIRADLAQDETDAAEILSRAKSLRAAGYFSRTEYFTLLHHLGTRLGIVS